jgi:hypothetical protein
MLRSLAPKQKNKFVFKVLPQNKEITRSLSDLYWLRSSLCVEFPYHYVDLEDPTDKGKGLQRKFYPSFLREAR